MPGKIGKYSIGRTLGQGASCKVKLGQDNETGRKVAIKIMNKNLDPETSALVAAECEALSKLKGHPNILEIIDQANDTYESRGKSKSVQYIALEIAQGGELFDYIAASGKFPEPLARYFFRQFMTGLDYVHESGFTHRDLKPENLMLSADFTLKIADFGFAGPVDGRDGSGVCSTNLGTLNYMAPEIHLGQDYDGKTIDIFAAAIILFIMVSEHPPFTAAQPNDPFYRCLAAQRADIFWKTHLKEKEPDFYTEDFKDLVQAMLHLDPGQRPTMAQIMEHPWMQGGEPSQAEVIAEFKNRKQLVDQQVQNEKQEKLSEQNSRNVSRVHRNAGAGKEEAKQIEDSKQQSAPSKELLQYEKIFDTNTEYFSSCNPDLIEEALVQHLKENERVEVKVNNDHYKIKFKLVTKGQDSKEQETEICVRILKVDDTKNCVEFTKIKGNQVNFHEAFNEIVKKTLNFSNDSVIE